MRQRLGIARALVHSPQVLFLDEPSLGPRGQREINALIKRLNREEGITVFLSSHLLSGIGGLCTRYAIVREGRLVAEGGRAELGARLGQSRRLRLEVSEPDRALHLARVLKGVREAHLEGETVMATALPVGRFGRRWVAQGSQAGGIRIPETSRACSPPADTLPLHGGPLATYSWRRVLRQSYSTHR